MTQEAPLGGGFKMIGGSFLGVSEKGFRVSSLVPQGYEENEDMIDSRGTGAGFNIQMLDKNGHVTGLYMFVRSCDKYGNWNDDAHWVDPQNHVIVPGGEYDTLFPAGTGLYFSTAEKCDEDEDDYTLMMNGEVLQQSVPVTLLNDKDTHEGGFQCLGNPFPVAINLSSIVPQGYEENEDMIDSRGTGASFNIQMLDGNGHVSGIYLWYHTCDKYGNWNEDGHWVTPDNKDIVFNPSTGKFDNDLTINSAEGVYFNSPDHVGDEDNDYTLMLVNPIQEK